MTRRWTEREDSIVRRLYGYRPVSAIGAEIDRTGKAVDIRRRKLGLANVSDWHHVLSIPQMAAAFGLTGPWVARLMREHLHGYDLYPHDKPHLFCDRDVVLRWLRRPESHRHVKLYKLRGKFRRAALDGLKQAGATVTPRDLIALGLVCQRSVYDYLRAGKIPARKHGKEWRIPAQAAVEFARQHMRTST